MIAFAARDNAGTAAAGLMACGGLAEVPVLYGILGFFNIVSHGYHSCDES